MPSAAGRQPGLRSALRTGWRWLWRGGATFIVASVLWVLWHSFGAVGLTQTMLQDRAQHGAVRFAYVPMIQITPTLPLAVVAAEDARFCDHMGFDFRAIRAAMALNAKGRKLYGASTLSQQVAKNLFLWPERSWLRKGLEAWFTLLIETLWSKRRILEVYLNVAAFDAQVYGAEAGAQAHFRLPAAKLSPDQAARLALMLPAPQRRDPIKLTAVPRGRLFAVKQGMATLTATGRDRCWQ